MKNRRAAPYGSGPRRLQQVPQVTVQILEHRDHAVALRLRIAHEDDTPGLIGRVVAPEMIGVQEQKDPATGLIAYARCLLRACGSGQEHRRSARPGRCDDDPALILRGGECVLHDSETQNPDKKFQRLVVVAHQQCRQANGLIQAHVLTNSARFGNTSTAACSRTISNKLWVRAHNVPNSTATGESAPTVKAVTCRGSGE